MLGVRRVRRWLFWLICPALTCLFACSRPLGGPTHPADAQLEQHQAPFDGHGTGASGLPGAGNQTSDFRDGVPPFRDGNNLPAGTFLTVQLQSPVYAGSPVSSASFEAVVVEPVIVQGSTVIPAGAIAEGRVEAAQVSKIKPNRGYVRLALESVQVAGIDVPIQTASLFARQSALVDQSDSSLHLDKGRRLTFRFSEPVYTPNQREQTAR